MYVLSPYGFAMSDSNKCVAREIQDTKSSFDRYGSVARWLLTTGVRYLLQFWFSKQAMFWLPKGHVPYAGEWILSFPSAPLGSVSINTWWIACASVMSLATDIFLALRSKDASSEKKAVPVPSGSNGASPDVRPLGEKKEL